MVSLPAWVATIGGDDSDDDWEMLSGSEPEPIKVTQHMAKLRKVKAETRLIKKKGAIVRKPIETWTAQASVQSQFAAELDSVKAMHALHKRNCSSHGLTPISMNSFCLDLLRQRGWRLKGNKFTLADAGA